MKFRDGQSDNFVIKQLLKARSPIYLIEGKITCFNDTQS